MTVNTDDIRLQARNILETYNRRLERVGTHQFMIRLNIFLTFVQLKSLEPEAYDFMQSVEGRVMSRAENSNGSIVVR